jgi:L-ascorbate metabolism protein UlaG (beta-lactamase superfamily)
MQQKLLPTHNPALQFCAPQYTGNQLSSQGLYCNLDGDSFRSAADVLKWQTSAKPLKEYKKMQKSNVEVHQDTQFMHDGADGITWLGHCSFILNLNGKKIITDPVLGKVSNVMPRYTALPIHTKELVGIDLILISHNHRDHLDKGSIKLLVEQNPNAIILTGLKIGQLLRRWKISNQIIEAGWWQHYPTLFDIQITYLPAKHWARRALVDTNDMLWGSFMITTGRHTIYFGADSGYGIHYQQIAQQFPKIDIAMLGIGAYMPEWFMAHSHTSPAGALAAATDLHTRQLIPMHYGTFDLSDEPVFWPKQEIQKLQANCNVAITTMEIGHKLFLST